MLTKALRQEDGTQSYKFTQIPDLIQCLLVSGAHGGSEQGARHREPGWHSRPRASCLTTPCPPNQCILQKEPNFLATLFRQKVILVIVKLR